MEASSIPKRSPATATLIGCPVWNCDAWSEIVYPARTPKREWLSWYTRMFNTVEGNNSFYAIPAEEHAQRWAREACEGFQFCMKFPREISHDRRLLNVNTATDEFLRVLYVLAEAGKAGPAFLQLGPDFSPRELGSLEAYLSKLPKDLTWAVEVRHLDWFDEAANEQRLDDLLRAQQVDRVIFDSRALYQAPPDDEIERVSQTRKPKSPIRTTTTSQRPMLRIVGRNRIELAEKFVDEWLPTIRNWVSDGLEPIIFTHAPDDAIAPQFARLFWEKLSTHAPELFPNDALPELPQQPKQLGFSFE